MLIEKKQNSLLQPFDNSPFIASIVNYILDNAGSVTKVPLHISIPDRNGIACWVAAVLQVNLFSNDFFNTFEDMGIKRGDLIGIGTKGTNIIAKYQHYSRETKKLKLTLRNGVEELSEEWPLVNPLWIKRVDNKNRRLTNQRGALQKFKESVNSFEPTAIDYILGVETYGNKDIFKHSILLLTPNVGPTKKQLSTIFFLEESLSNIVCEGHNLIIRHDRLEDIIWTAGDDVKRTIRNTLIDIVITDRNEQDELKKQLLCASSKIALSKVLDIIKEKLEAVPQVDRRQRLKTLLKSLHKEVDKLPHAILTEQVKFILIDGPDCMLADPDSFTRIVDSGIPVIIFTDPRSLVDAFGRHSCLDESNKLLPSYQKVFQSFEKVFDAANTLQNIKPEDVKKYADCEVLAKNLNFGSFDIEIKEINIPRSIIELGMLKSEFFRFRDKSTESNFLKVFSTYILPVLDLLTNYAATLPPDIEQLVLNALTDYRVEINRDCYFAKYLSEDAKRIGTPDHIEASIQSGLDEIRTHWGVYINSCIPYEFSLFFSELNKYSSHLAGQNLVNESTELNRNINLCFYGFSFRNFRYLIDRCLRREVRKVLFLGSSNECRYLEKRIKNAFSINSAVLHTRFMGNHEALVDYIKVRYAISPAGQQTSEIVNANMFQYLETIHISIAGTMPRTTMAGLANKELKAGVLFLENGSLLYYPLEGNKFFAFSEDNNILKLDRLQNFRRGDYLVWIPELQQAIKRIIQDALQVFNRNAYSMIYEWRDFLRRLQTHYEGINKLAIALIDEKLTNHNLSQLKINLHRWLDAEADTWMPVDDNVYMIYRMAALKGYCSEENIDSRIALAKEYMLKATKIRVSVRDEIKMELGNHIDTIRHGNSFFISIQGHRLRVFPYEIYDNNTTGIHIDGSLTYKIIEVTE